MMSGESTSGKMSLRAKIAAAVVVAAFLWLGWQLTATLLVARPTEVTVVKTEIDPRNGNKMVYTKEGEFTCNDASWRCYWNSGAVYGKLADEKRYRIYRYWFRWYLPTSYPNIVKVEEIE